MARFSGEASIMRACTSAAVDSQARGGQSIAVGPISRMSAGVVSTSSQKLKVKRDSSHWPSATCSPIQGSGSTETYSSPGPRGSTFSISAAWPRKPAALSIAGLGCEVVPEVVHRMATACGSSAASRRSQACGSSRSVVSPRSSSVASGSRRVSPPSPSCFHMPRGSA